MNIALWAAQILTAVLFFWVASMKVFAYDKFKAMAGPKPLAKGLATFTGWCEIAGAVGLVLPWATGILPILTPIAASALVVVLILALGYHIQRKDPIGKSIPVVVFLLINAFIAWGRF